MKREELNKLRNATAAEILADAGLSVLLARAGVFIWGLAPSTCTKALKRRIAQIHKLSNKQILKLFDMQKSKFKLKKGVVLYSAAKHQHFTNANLTDKIAIDIVRESPKAANSFEVAPTEEDMAAKTKSAQYTAEECIALINNAQDIEALEFFKGDKRVTVVKAAEARAEALQTPEPTAEELEAANAQTSTEESTEDGADLSE